MIKTKADRRGSQFKSMNGTFIDSSLLILLMTILKF